MLQSQLEEEYAANKDLRKENKEISDELLDCKEKLIEKISKEKKSVIISDLNLMFTDIIKKLIDSNTFNIKGRKEIQELVENSIQSKKFSSSYF